MPSKGNSIMKTTILEKWSKPAAGKSPALAFYLERTDGRIPGITMEVMTMDDGLWLTFQQAFTPEQLRSLAAFLERAAVAVGPVGASPADHSAKNADDALNGRGPWDPRKN
jgi:hypothetical protein